MSSIYDVCANAEEVDRLTSVRINQLHGSVPGDELKNLRRGLLALVSLIKPQLFPKKDRDDVMEYGDKLLSMNGQIESIIAEGRSFKKEKGWA